MDNTVRNIEYYIKRGERVIIMLTAEGELGNVPISWTLYPVVNVPSGMQLEPNFGHAPFCCDIDSYVRRYSTPTILQNLISRLPIELLLEVRRYMRAVQDNALFHMACSTVCKSWQSIFRPREAYMHIILRSAQCMHDEFVSPPAVTPTYVRKLDVHSDSYNPWAHILFVSPATSAARYLSHLSLNGGEQNNQCFLARYPPQLKSRLPALFGGFRHLESLTFSDQKFKSFRELVRLIAPIPKLTQLYLENVRWDLPMSVEDPPMWWHVPKNLRFVRRFNRIREQHDLLAEEQSLHDRDVLSLFLMHTTHTSQSAPKTDSFHLNRRDGHSLYTTMGALLKFVRGYMDLGFALEKDLGSPRCE